MRSHREAFLAALATFVYMNFFGGKQPWLRHKSRLLLNQFSISQSDSTSMTKRKIVRPFLVYIVRKTRIYLPKLIRWKQDFLNVDDARTMINSKDTKNVGKLDRRPFANPLLYTLYLHLSKSSIIAGHPYWSQWYKRDIFKTFFKTDLSCFKVTDF